jgi:hypothetical protein
MIFLDGGYVGSGPAGFEFKKSVGFNTSQMFDILQDITKLTLLPFNANGLNI